MTQFKFSVGPWNVHTGADAYGPATRKDIPIEEKFKNLQRSDSQQSSSMMMTLYRTSMIIQKKKSKKST